MSEAPERNPVSPPGSGVSAATRRDLMPVDGVPMTHAAYLDTPEGLGYNLLHGLCFREEPTVDHQVAVRNVVGLLHRYARALRRGRALPAINVDLGEGDVPAPDACFVSWERVLRMNLYFAKIRLGP